MKTTFGGVRANLSAHGGSTERKRGVSVLVSGLILTTDCHGRGSLTFALSLKYEPKRSVIVLFI